MTTPRTAIVTGASRGIGRAIAAALGGLHGNVVINFNANAAAAQEAAALVKEQGGDAICVQADIANLDDHVRLVEAALAKFGRIDLLVNNAGIAPKVRADLLEAGPDSFDDLIRTNLRGPYFLTQRVAKVMIGQLQRPDGAQSSQASASGGGDEGMIVNISSMSAYTASVNRGDYCISKAGIGMMTALFAARLAPYRINVYEVRPGIIATDMTGPVKAKYDQLILEDGLLPLRRWGQPDDIGKAVAALASGALPYSTGQVLNVDGGFHLRTL
jgi:NAD(P)-dependent dehydrogenase (short-subunit alcohol dehydrogenase family)